MSISADVASLVQRSLPILNWISAYRREWLIPDVFAGLGVWAVMVPEGMAYAGIVGGIHLRQKEAGTFQATSHLNPSISVFETQYFIAAIILSCITGFL